MRVEMSFGRRVLCLGVLIVQVLDESHTICSYSRIAVAVEDIIANRRWCMTGYVPRMLSPGSIWAVAKRVIYSVCVLPYIVRSLASVSTSTILIFRVATNFMSRGKNDASSFFTLSPAPKPYSRAATSRVEKLHPDCCLASVLASACMIKCFMSSQAHRSVYPRLYF